MGDVNYVADTTLFVKVCRILEEEYSRPDPSNPPLGNLLDPLDELVYIMLTIMTEHNTQKIFTRLKSRYPSWDLVLDSDKEEFYNIIRPLGLVRQRGDRILKIFEALKATFGKVTLDPVKEMTDVEAERFLTSLPGVGKKTARCVMMYSLLRKVFPVDTHVLRVCRRLGLIHPSIPWNKAHDILQEKVPPDYRYSLHVNLVRHGRTVCKAQRPNCVACVISEMCVEKKIKA